MLFLFLKHHIWFSHLVLRLPTRWSSESVYFFISLQPNITFLWFNVLKERAHYKKNKLSLSHGQSLCQCLWWRHMTKLFLPIADTTEDTEPWTSSLTKFYLNAVARQVSIPSSLHFIRMSECVLVRICTDIWNFFFIGHIFHASLCWYITITVTGAQNVDCEFKKKKKKKSL